MRLNEIHNHLEQLKKLYRNGKGDKENIAKNISNLYNELSVVDSQNSIKHLRESLNYYKKNELVYNNIAHIYLNHNNDYKNAEFFYKKALEINPKFIQAYKGINIVYMHTGNFSNQLLWAEKSIENIPNDGDLYNNKGVSLIKLNRIDEGLVCLKKGEEMEKNAAILAKIYMNMSFIYNIMGYTDECMVYYLKSLKQDPAHSLTYHNILLCIHYFKEIPDFLLSFEFVNKPSFEYTKKNHDFFHRYLAEILYSKVYKMPSVKKAQKDSNKIRIGYVSGDALNHAVSMFVNPIFNLYDSDAFEVYMYSTKYIAPDRISLIGKNINYRHIQNFNTDKVCDMILNDSIDKLIDLSGYTAENRLDVFGKFSYLGEGPELYTYLGYPDNTGIKGVTRISDSYTEQYSIDTDYTRTVKMPRIFLCFKPLVEVQIIKKKIPQYENCIVLGSFAKLQKINQEVILTWTKIIEKLTQLGKNVIFLLKSKIFSNDQHVLRWRSYFKGFEKNIVVFRHTDHYANHIDLYNVLDLELDTWPYSGTTITCEALYMNTPVITYCPPDTAHVSRVSASILNEMGLNEYIVDNLESYVSKAVEVILRDDKTNVKIHDKFVEVMEPTRFIKEYETLLIKKK